ncbi:MAG: recombinase family protein [Nitrospirota bacterium]|nr:recombinase family protein [Nitrospirota bacterium]
MKVSIYCRVSTIDQSVEMQRSDLSRYCEQRGFEIVQEYTDEGVSGTKDRRPALDALMGDARKRLFDGVVCWRFDRFARSTKHLISVLDEFRHLGIEFISYQENIDTASPLGKAMFTIVAAIAELERNIIVERIRGGIRRAREQGKRLGRRPLTDPILLRTVLQMKAQGRSIRAIAEAVKVSKSFVHKTCKNPNSQTLEIPASQS